MNRYNNGLAIVLNVKVLHVVVFELEVEDTVNEGRRHPVVGCVTFTLVPL